MSSDKIILPKLPEQLGGYGTLCLQNGPGQSIEKIYYPAVMIIKWGIVFAAHQIGPSDGQVAVAADLAGAAVPGGPPG